MGKLYPVMNKKSTEWQKKQKKNADHTKKQTKKHNPGYKKRIQYP
jgi:hypothetical protein